MTQEHRELDQEKVALSGHTNGTAHGQPESARDTDDPTADARTAEALAVGLGALRTPRPGFEDVLERRLLDRLAEPARSWWRLGSAPNAPAQRTRPGVRRLPRRSLLGLAAASALALAAASLSLPLSGTPEVSALEIFEKAHANAENPILSGVRSFHLTAKMWSNHRGKPGGGGPVEMTTEQWFVAPDKMRTESRSRDAAGKSVTTGMMVKGSEAKHYSTDGANDVVMIGVAAAPIAAKPAGEIREGGASARPPEGAVVRGEAITIAVGSPSPGNQTEGASSGVAVARPGVRVGPPDGSRAVNITAVYEASDGGEPVVFTAENCPEPKRTGEGTVAGRSVFVIENDFSTCMPKEAPDEMRGRHVRWVDQKTFLPLKLESYDAKGALIDRYEVTSIEYDVEIPDKTFTEPPAGTSVREPVLITTTRSGGAAPVVPTDKSSGR